MVSRRVFLPLLVAALVSACAAIRKSSPPDPEPTTLSVDNRAFLDMNIYAVDGSRRQKLGFAGGNRVTKLIIPRSIIGNGRSIQFFADPVGGRRTGMSQEIYVTHGDNVTLMIPPG